ncbi:MAG: FAD binding domain-containing protein [Deltaproteobacteria bacterium]|nr:FAD binding domain-containing protein [Deltaproteobacteria bacterium]
MKSFAHYNARSLREASKLLTRYEGKAKVNAGGTDLLGAMRDKSIPVYPEAVINIKTIEGLDYIKKDAKGLKIGALARLADIAHSPEVREGYGLLAEAVHSVATPQVRNMATVGGNLAQDVRCWYYRYPRQIGGPIVCLRKGGKICNALLGDNRYHSIFGAAPVSQYPCSGHCPAGTRIQSFLDHVKAGDLDRGARTLMDHNPIPAITGRVCPAFCEAYCNRNEFDEPVAIRSIERGLGDYLLQKSEQFYGKPARLSGKSVAIVGSGPAGLTAAYYLRKAGHRVVVFERLPKAGGMLTHSIPSYRLPRHVVEMQIGAIQGMGVQIRVGVEVGSKVTIPQLMEEFDAVFLAAGAWKERSLGVEGEDIASSGLGFLNRVSAGSKEIPGNRVAIVGGGNVAIDVARTLRRLNAKPVVLYRRSKAEMPALKKELQKAEAEGVEFSFLTLPAHLSRSADGVVLECVRMKLGAPDGSGRPRPERVPGSAYVITFDAVIQAIGEEPDYTILPEEVREQAKRASVLSFRKKSLFLGGDFLTGPSTVAAAVAAGRETASEIRSSFGERVSSQAKGEKAYAFVRPFLDVTTSRIPRRELPASEGVVTLDAEDLPGHREGDMEREAHRCFNCGCLAVAPSDVGIALVALDARIVTTKRNLTAKDFFRASATRSTVLEPDELIKEIRIPKPPAGARQRYEKFTLRKPVDFAIVSVASLVTAEGGICKDARIVLGAVAPEPVRAKKAEDAIKGRLINETTAAEAAEQAVAGSMPLPMNDYKIAITKALVKRAIMA